ncbi:MAG: capsid cement protein [Reyranella sp.]|uniref:capsid cement protein n=1 Tax=Reyranella sp. TaxID=1929291 RepID=UPI003D0D9995
MALGSPAIGNARSVEPREINGLVASIRQRIEALERLLTTLQNTAPGPTAAADIQTLKIQVSQLQQVVNSLSSGSGSALSTQTLRASSAIRQFYPVYGSGSGTCAEANPNDPTTIYNVLGVALAAAASGASVLVQREGVFTITGATFTAFEPVFLGIEGLTQWPEYTNVSVPIGIALSTTTVYVKPGFPALQYLGVYNNAEQHMPVTYRLLADALLPLTQLLASSDGYVFLSDGQLITLTSGGGGGGGSGYVNDGDYVDIEVTFGGTVWTIKAGQVTLTKLADLPAETIIGNANLSGPGAPQALTPAQVKSMLNIDVGDIIDFVESVLALLAGSLVAGTGINISSNSAGQQVISATGGGGGINWTNSSSAPGSPTDGDEWFDPDTGILYRYVNDGTSSQWVEL